MGEHGIHDIRAERKRGRQASTDGQRLTEGIQAWNFQVAWFQPRLQVVGARASGPIKLRNGDAHFSAEALAYDRCKEMCFVYGAAILRRA